MDRADVVKAWECCIDPEIGSCAEDCPMKGAEWKETGLAACRAFADDHVEVPLALIERTVKLLKAQEPRVLELEEVNRLEQNEVVWLEDKGIEEIIPAIVVSHGHLYAQQSVCLMIVENPRLWIATFDYRERWRCWTSRPTDEQREAEPWRQ